MRKLSSLVLVALATFAAVALARTAVPGVMSVAPNKPPRDAGMDGGAPLPPIPDGGPVKSDAAQPMK
jgi:hypothetical protein